jgi:hypothetical protein
LLLVPERKTQGQNEFDFDVTDTVERGAKTGTFAAAATGIRARVELPVVAPRITWTLS